jgi:hypothetical protein
MQYLPAATRSESVSGEQLALAWESESGEVYRSERVQYPRAASRSESALSWGSGTDEA